MSYSQRWWEPPQLCRFWLGGRWLARALRERGRVVALGLFALLLVAELANRFVLPRLYPAFHWGLSLGCLALAPWVVLAALGSAAVQRRWLPFGCGLLLLAAGLALVPAARALSGFDNMRWLLLERAPSMGKVVELCAAVAPPAPAELADCVESPNAPGCQSSQSAVGAGGLDLRGHHVLLVTIDALRADHIGAYGYTRPTTPNIDKLAQEGSVFERAYSATPHTSYALTSLMTGKYMRPLLQQGAGADSDSWASLLRTYGYRTAAFYPPAVFFIDTQRFTSFQKQNLGFEYAKVEFAEGELRVAQVREYLNREAADHPLFMWVHLFGPHEPYVNHAAHAFGDRDLDRYDSEVADADQTLGQLVEAFRAKHPKSLVIVHADHGEEFGDHGGRYHGTTVYEEQLRVPLIVSAPGLVPARRVREVVQSIDLVPTLLGALQIPKPPRLRGRDLGALLAGKRAEEPGLAFGETDEQTLLARGDLRLICARRIGACKLYDLAKDPGETVDATDAHHGEAEQMRSELREIAASHGRFESQGLRAEGKGWPAAILRGLAGDADAAPEVGNLLDDVDPQIRKKAAQVLFELRRPESAPALRLALSRNDAPEVRRFAALALTRLGEGAPLVVELLESPDLELRRLSALALAESGDKRGANQLLEWWRADRGGDFQRSRDLLAALGTLRLKDAVWPLTTSLNDVRLRPYIARALARDRRRQRAGAAHASVRRRAFAKRARRAGGGAGRARGARRARRATDALLGRAGPVARRRKDGHRLSQPGARRWARRARLEPHPQPCRNWYPRAHRRPQGRKRAGGASAGARQLPERRGNRHHRAQQRESPAPFRLDGQGRPRAGSAQAGPGTLAAPRPAVRGQAARGIWHAAPTGRRPPGYERGIGAVFEPERDARGARFRASGGRAAPAAAQTLEPRVGRG
ncbi:MAG: sulfatase-like hydrolase/transferase [Polyangiaceae bacterium]